MDENRSKELGEYLQLCKDLGYYVEVPSDNLEPVFLADVVQ